MELAYEKQLPPNKPTQEELDAGYARLAKAFGFFGTLVAMEKETSLTGNDLLKWPIGEFKYRLLYMAHKRAVDLKHDELMAKKYDQKRGK